MHDSQRYLSVKSVLVRRGVASDAPALAEFAARTFADTFGTGNRPEDLQAHLASAYGIAQTFMAAAQEVARELGGLHTWLGVWERNPRALAFYKKQGFIDVGSTTFHVGASSCAHFLSTTETSRACVGGIRQSVPKRLWGRCNPWVGCCRSLHPSCHTQASWELTSMASRAGRKARSGRLLFLIHWAPPRSGWVSQLG